MNPLEATSPKQKFESEHEVEISQFREKITKFYETLGQIDGYQEIFEFVEALKNKYGDKKVKSCYLYHAVAGSSPFENDGSDTFNIEKLDFEGEDSIEGYLDILIRNREGLA